MSSNKLIFEKQEFESTIKSSTSIADVCRHYGKPKNGYYTKLFQKWVEHFGCDTSHFGLNKITLVCQHCGNKFETIPSKKDERKFCSLLCANQKVRGKALPRPDNELICQNKHKVICFRYHEKKCCICGITNPVAVHHYNENHKDDRPENLVPICPNHHVLIHTNDFAKDVQPIVDEYVKKFKNGGMV